MKYRGSAPFFCHLLFFCTLFFCCCFPYVVILLYFLLFFPYAVFFAAAFIVIPRTLFFRCSFCCFSVVFSCNTFLYDRTAHSIPVSGSSPPGTPGYFSPDILSALPALFRPEFENDADYRRQGQEDHRVQLADLRQHLILLKAFKGPQVHQ